MIGFSGANRVSGWKVFGLARLKSARIDRSPKVERIEIILDADSIGHLRGIVEDALAREIRRNAVDFRGVLLIVGICVTKRGVDQPILGRDDVDLQLAALIGRRTGILRHAGAAWVIGFLREEIDLEVFILRIEDVRVHADTTVEKLALDADSYEVSVSGS